MSATGPSPSATRWCCSGQQGDEEITADEWAERLDTINYEIVCDFGPRLPRRYREGSPGMSERTLTSVPGVEVGHYTDVAAATGVTVMVFPEPNVAAVDLRGPPRGLERWGCLVRG